MKNLSKEATAIFLTILSRLEEHEQSLKQNGRNEDAEALIIDANGPGSGIMPLVVKRLESAKLGGGEVAIISLAHHAASIPGGFRDPEMRFMVNRRDGEAVIPCYFGMDGCPNPAYGEQPSVLFEKGRVKEYYPRKQAGQTAFANQWMKNLKHQQNL